MTDCPRNWINAQKKQEYPKWLGENYSDPEKHPQKNHTHQLIPRLPMKWNLQTTQISEELYYSFVCDWLFLKDLKGCLKGTRGTDYPLYSSVQN